MSKVVLDIYKLDPVNGSFTRIDQIESFTDLSFFYGINGQGGGKFSINANDKKATRTNLTRFINHIAIKIDGVYVPRLFHVDDVDINAEGVRGELDVSLATHFSHLKARYTDDLVIRQNEDIIDTLQYLLNYTQGLANGDLGITLGTSPTIGTEFSQRYENERISDAILDLTEFLISFDFELIPKLDADGLINEIIFNAYKGRLGKVRDDVPPFELPGNIQELGMKAKDQLINSRKLKGAGTGEGTYISEQNDGNSQTAYTRREAVDSINYASLAQTVSAINEAQLNKLAREGFEFDLDLAPTIRPTIEDFNLGDIMNLKINFGNQDGYLNFDNQRVRIIQLNYNVLDAGTVKINPRIKTIF